MKVGAVIRKAIPPQIDLADIRSRYKELYSTDLVEDIEADCSGDYCKLLVALVEGESQ